MGKLVKSYYNDIISINLSKVFGIIIYLRKKLTKLCHYKNTEMLIKY